MYHIFIYFYISINSIFIMRFIYFVYFIYFIYFVYLAGAFCGPTTHRSSACSAKEMQEHSVAPDATVAAQLQHPGALQERAAALKKNSFIN